MIKELSTDVVILTPEKIMSLYDMGRDETYFYLRQKGCPVLPRKRNGPYKVIQGEFETWLKNQKNR